LAKVGLLVIQTWAQVLLANPGSRMVMKARAFVDPECRAAYQAHTRNFHFDSSWTRCGQRYGKLKESSICL
jgi:hypothetical protein